MDLEELQEQHYNNYVEAVKETVKSNTKSLLENDINPLFRTPPLDSMDQIKTKFLMTAKKENLVLKTEELNKILANFRKNIETNLVKISELRNNEIINSLIKEKNNIKLLKTDLNKIDKKIKKIIKEELNLCVSKYIVLKLDKVFDNKNNNENALKEIEKYFNIKGIYQKQLLENIDFKLLVKDTILINSIKEQTERYLFTLNNSRIFNE